MASDNSMNSNENKETLREILQIPTLTLSDSKKQEGIKNQLRSRPLETIYSNREE